MIGARVLRHVVVPMSVCLGGAAMATDPAVQVMADSCAMCHGTDGRSAGSIDGLHGIEAEEFVEEMQEFRDEGEGRIMSVIAKAYDAAEIRALARHFESLPRSGDDR